MSTFQIPQQSRQDRWCRKCQCDMELDQRQSCALPVWVLSGDPLRNNAAHYGKHLVRVDPNRDIPAGMYACGVHVYHCPECRRRRVRLTVFLSGGQEVFLFEKGELDSFLSTT